MSPSTSVRLQLLYHNILHPDKLTPDVTISSRYAAHCIYSFIAIHTTCWKGFNLILLPNFIAIEMTRNSSKKRRNSFAVMKRKSASFHQPILYLMSVITLSSISIKVIKVQMATLSLTATSRMLMTSHEAPAINLTIEEPSTRCLFQMEHHSLLPRDRATPSDIKDYRFATIGHIFLKT